MKRADGEYLLQWKKTKLRRNQAMYAWMIFHTMRKELKSGLQGILDLNFLLCIVKQLGRLP